MKNRMAFIAATAAALVGFQSIAPALHADTRKFQEIVTVKGTARHASGEYALTFHGPVALPGVSLGSGTYVFRHTGANALQVSNMDGVPYGMFLTIPTYRDVVTDQFSIVIGSSAADESPKRLMAIFEPGESMGREFLYTAR